MKEAQLGRVEAEETPARPRAHPFRGVVASIGVDNLSLLMALAAVVAIIVSQTDKFLGWQNLMNSLGQSIVVVGLLAIGETVVIVAGMLDISVGSIAGVSSVVAALVVTGGVMAIVGPGSMQVALVAGVLAGLAAGIVNGLIVSVLRVNAIIATLGTFAAFNGLAFLIAPGGKPVGVLTQPDFTWLGTGRFLSELPVPPLGNQPWTGIPVLFVILLIAIVAVHVLMRYTDFGRAVYAIGGNPTAARLAGINLTRVRVAIYALSGAIAGLAGVLLTARTTSGHPNNGQGLELQAITAVFLGGAATAGGKGTVVGTVLAVLLVGVLSNGMNLTGVNQFYQRVALGLLLVVSVAIAQWRQARAERVRTRIAAAG